MIMDMISVSDMGYYGCRSEVNGKFE